MEPGVSGVPPVCKLLRPNIGSELCLRRDKLNIPPRLVLPDVEVDVLVDCGMGGVGSPSSSIALRSELIVDDLPRNWRPAGRPVVVEDLVDRRDADESLLNKFDPGAANARDVAASAVCVGEDCPFRRLNGLGISGVSLATEKESRMGDSGGRPLVERRGVLAAERSEVVTRGGKGNSGPLSFFRRGKRKKVVVVDTV